MSTNSSSQPAWDVIDIPEVADEQGSLAYLEQENEVPFEICRVYYLYDFSGIKRGEHAHRELEQVLIAVHGGLTVHLDDGFDRTSVRLDDPSEGLYLPPMTWRELEDPEPQTVCLVLASDYFDEADYIRDYDTFFKWRQDTSSERGTN